MGKKEVLGENKYTPKEALAIMADYLIDCLIASIDYEGCAAMDTYHHVALHSSWKISRLVESKEHQKKRSEYCKPIYGKWYDIKKEDRKSIIYDTCVDAIKFVKANKPKDCGNVSCTAEKLKILKARIGWPVKGKKNEN